MHKSNTTNHTTIITTRRAAAAAAATTTTTEQAGDILGNTNNPRGIAGVRSPILKKKSTCHIYIYITLSSNG